MIAPLENIFFFIPVSLVYLFLLSLTLKRLKFFVYLSNLKFIQNLKRKIKIIEKVRTLLQNSILRTKLVLTPVMHPSVLGLEKLSSGLNEAETQSTIFISKNLKEALHFISLVARKSVNAEVNAAWSLLFVIVVVIYFILTNF